jgi:hypothetical protein
VARACTVLIAASDLLPDLKRRARDGDTELLIFSDAEALRALEVITKRHPRVVALERLFAATPRGSALISRIKADPTLMNSEIRVVSHDSEFAPAAAADPAGSRSDAGERPAQALAAPVAVLDQRGTRRAPRFRMAGSVEIVADGNSAVLVDLSIIGAQVISPNALKPNQRVRVVLSDADGSVRFNAVVAWAKFEIPPGSGPRYRAGLEFADADAPAVDAFCTRHKV